MEIGEVFRDELKDELARFELIVLNLEKGESFAIRMDQAKRILHNMKGSARVAGYEACGRVIHHMESLLIERPITEVLETLLRGMDLALSLVEPFGDERAADLFVGRIQTASVQPAAPRISPTPKTQVSCAPAHKEHSSKKTVDQLESMRILVCGDHNQLHSNPQLANDRRITLQWQERTEDIALLLQEQIFDAVVLDFSCLSLAQGSAIRRIRRVSEFMPIILLAESITPCLMAQATRMENVSCFLRPIPCLQSFVRHLQRRILLARQTVMLSRALRTIWYLDPWQDPRMEQNVRALMHYQDAMRSVGSSHQEWDFENHSQQDKHSILSDEHHEIDLLLNDLMQRIDQKNLPMPLVRLRHRHLLDCLHQHFLEENAMMSGHSPNKKFLEQHIRHHEEAMQEFHSQSMMKDIDDIRIFCDRLTQFIRQHESFDQTLEEYLLRESV